MRAQLFHTITEHLTTTDQERKEMKKGIQKGERKAPIPPSQMKGKHVSIDFECFYRVLGGKNWCICWQYKEIGHGARIIRVSCVVSNRCAVRGDLSRLLSGLLIRGAFSFQLNVSPEKELPELLLGPT